MKTGDLVKFRWYHARPPAAAPRSYDPRYQTGIILKKYPPSMRIAVRGDAWDVLVSCTGLIHQFRTSDLEVINDSR